MDMCNDLVYCMLTACTVSWMMCGFVRSFQVVDAYQSAEELCRDAVDGGPQEFLVEFCLQLCLNENTRGQNTLARFKEDRGREG